MTHLCIGQLHSVLLHSSFRFITIFVPRAHLWGGGSGGIRSDLILIVEIWSGGQSKAKPGKFNFCVGTEEVGGESIGDGGLEADTLLFRPGVESPFGYVNSGRNQGAEGFNYK